MICDYSTIFGRRRIVFSQKIDTIRNKLIVDGKS